MLYVSKPRTYLNLKQKSSYVAMTFCFEIPLASFFRFSIHFFPIDFEKEHFLNLSHFVSFSANTFKLVSCLLGNIKKHCTAFHPSVTPFFCPSLFSHLLQFIFHGQFNFSHLLQFISLRDSMLEALI